MISVFYRIPPVITGQHCFYLISFKSFQLMGESGTCLRIGTFVTTVILCIKSSFLVFLLPPVVPAYGKDVLSQFATDKYGLGIRTPGTGEIYFLRFS